MFRHRNDLSDPVQISLAALLDGRGNDLRDVVRVVRVDVLGQVGHPLGPRLDHEEQLRVVLDFSLPLVDRRHPGQDVHARGVLARH